MNSLLYYLTELSVNDLKRMQNSPKGWFLFNVSVFNAGTVVAVKCTDTFKNFGNNWNGYDIIVSNDDEVQRFVKSELSKKLEPLN